MSGLTICRYQFPMSASVFLPCSPLTPANRKSSSPCQETFTYEHNAGNANSA